MKIKSLQFLSSIFAIFVGTDIYKSYAYEFQFLGMGNPVHEQLTEAALRCVIENSNDNFTNCENFIPSTRNMTLPLDINGMNELTVEDLVYAVRWPDDPVRELRGYKLLKIPLWGAHMRYAKCKGKRDGFEDGLRCSSHYGPAQFMHSMEGKYHEMPSETKNVILDWISFSYQVSVNKQENGKYFSETDYCDYFSNLPSETYFKQVMYPNGGNGFPCKVKDSDPWRVSTPFSLSCSIGVYNCTEWNGVNDLRVRRAALGAILHAIQDSYANGHTMRGEVNHENINQYSCSAIKQFQVYSKQNADKHKHADLKAEPSINCLNPSLNDDSVHGPITASAHIIRLFKNKAIPTEIYSYLEKHVFVTNANAAPADSHEYFIENK